jgi:hypothetical protein
MRNLVRWELRSTDAAGPGQTIVEQGFADAGSRPPRGNGAIDQARRKIEAWRIDYNEQRPHGALGHLTPSEFADAGRKAAPEVTELQLKTVC